MQQIKRLYYLDWLRVSAFSLLILFHSWQPFTNFSWLLKSDHTTILADVFSVFFHTWRLHLIFFISGIGTWFALRLPIKSFFYDRIKRLMIPFVFGIIFIVPYQYYYQLLQQNKETGFIDFMLSYPKFIADKNLSFDIFSWNIEIGIHLWYLSYLFLMSLLLYPVLKQIQKKGLSQKFIDKLSLNPRLILLLALPIIIILIILQPIFPDYTNLADFLVYLCFFVYGFIFIKEHDQLLPILHRNHRVLLILGILSSLSLIGFLLDETLRKAAFEPEYSLNHLIVSVPIGLSAFSWTLYLVSLFSQKFNFNHKALTELNTSVLPLYIVHQTIIVIGGFYIINSIDQGLLQFILIVLTTIIGSSIAYFFIKVFKITRFLFGLKN